MGLGRFGGGIGITRWLIESGAHVQVTDTADAQLLNESLLNLDDLFQSDRLKITHGPHNPELLNDSDILVVNPAVPQPWKNPFIIQAHAQGLKITTEIEIAYQHLDPSRIIAVSGSAGKSTTSAMIHHILESTGHRSILAGNIGGSLLSRLGDIKDDSFVVLEISSAMIYWLWMHEYRQTHNLAPSTACMTNFTPNHLDWHGDQEHYEYSKKQLLSILPSNATMILGESLKSWSVFTKAQMIVVESKDSIPDCTVPGKHNAMNAAMAVAAVNASLKSSQEIRPMISAVQSFAGLPHRLYRFHNHEGVVYFNDSKSTVPQATCLAVNSITEQVPRNRIHLICGGYDKGSDLTPIIELASNIAGFYAIGATGECISQRTKSTNYETLERATKAAYENSNPGDAIVLSPGCASWDQFTNYEERGNRFEKLVQQLTMNNSCSPNS